MKKILLCDTSAITLSHVRRLPSPQPGQGKQLGCTRKRDLILLSYDCTVVSTASISVSTADAWVLLNYPWQRRTRFVGVCAITIAAQEGGGHRWVGQLDSASVPHLGLLSPCTSCAQETLFSGFAIRSPLPVSTQLCRLARPISGVSLSNRGHNIISPGEKAFGCGSEERRH